MPDTTTKGFPYPEGPDAVDVAGDIQALAEAVDDMPGVQSYTATEITNLTAGEKWAGRIVWNSTAGKLQVSNGSTFSDVDSTSLSSVNPQALGIAAPGASTDASRADHVHAMPTAADVGAPPTSRTISAGNGLTGGGDLSTNRSLAANFSATNPAMNGAAAAGSANAVSRGDHVHPIDTSRAPLASPTFTGTPAAPTAAADTNTTQVATTAYVVGQAGAANPVINGTAAPGTSLRYARQDHVHPTDTSRAALASPTFTGTPAAPTAAADTNTTQIATTAYVIGQAGSTTPAALGSAAVGTSNRYARADHVHAMPTAANVGAIATTALTSTNPSALGATAAPGSSTNVARLDHVHARPTPADIGAVANSLVDAKGDLLTATADNTPARLAAGSNGQMLMADSSATAGLRYVDPPASRNLAYNGAMQVHQRGTSVTGASGGAYRTADRWLTSFNATGNAFTQTIENDAPSGSGLAKSNKFLCTTAKASLSGTDFIAMSQPFEGQDLQRIKKGSASAEQLTLSFWVKSNVTGTYVAEFQDNDNARGVSVSYTISASATWEKKTLTFPADTTGPLDNDTNSSATLRFWLAAGSDFTSGLLQTTWGALTTANRAVGQTNLAAATNNYWQVTGVQLETGPVATPFEFEPFEATLRKCQRYYYRLDATSDGNGTVFAPNGLVATTTIVESVVTLPTTMRVAPTILEVSRASIYNWSNSTQYSTGTWTTTSAQPHQVNIRYTHGTAVFTVGQSVAIVKNGSASELTHISFGSEL